MGPTGAGYSGEKGRIVCTYRTVSQRSSPIESGIALRTNWELNTLEKAYEEHNERQYKGENCV